MASVCTSTGQYLQGVNAQKQTASVTLLCQSWTANISPDPPSTRLIAVGILWEWTWKHQGDEKWQKGWGSGVVVVWLSGSKCCKGVNPMSSEGLVKLDQECWSHPYCAQGSGTEGWGQTETGTEQNGVLGRVWGIQTCRHIERYVCSNVLTWNRWAPWRRVAGLRGATGLSVLQKWMLDSRGLGVSNRVGVWGGRHC